MVPILTVWPSPPSSSILVLFSPSLMISEGEWTFMIFILSSVFLRQMSFPVLHFWIWLVWLLRATRFENLSLISYVIYKYFLFICRFLFYSYCLLIHTFLNFHNPTHISFFNPMYFWYYVKEITVNSLLWFVAFSSKCFIFHVLTLGHGSIY